MKSLLSSEEGFTKGVPAALAFRAVTDQFDPLKKYGLDQMISINTKRLDAIKDPEAYLNKKQKAMEALQTAAEKKYGELTKDASFTELVKQNDITPVQMMALIDSQMKAFIQEGLMLINYQYPDEFTKMATKDAVFSSKMEGKVSKKKVAKSRKEEKK